MRHRKITFALVTVLSSHLLAMFDKIEGSHIVAIYCALIALFNVGNMVEHVKGGN